MPQETNKEVKKLFTNVNNKLKQFVNKTYLVLVDNKYILISSEIRTEQLDNLGESGIMYYCQLVSEILYHESAKIKLPSFLRDTYYDYYGEKRGKIGKKPLFNTQTQQYESIMLNN